MFPLGTGAEGWVPSTLGLERCFAACGSRRGEENKKSKKGETNKNKHWKYKNQEQGKWET